MRTRTVLLTLAALSLILPVQATAADGFLKAVHGINGRDLGASKNFPVDVAVDGACAVPNFRFGEITDYIPLPGGTYRLDISPADGACGAAPVLSADVRVHPGQFITAVAHLTADGAPTATRFRDNQNAARSRFGRITVRHTAAAPTVDVTVSAKRNKVKNYAFSGVSNGEQGNATFFAKNYYARIFPYLGGDVVAGPVAAPVSAGANLYVYAVGSLANGTFTLLVDSEPLKTP